MPRGVYYRGPKVGKSKVAKVKVVKQHDPEKRRNGGLLEICEDSLRRRSQLCDILDKALDDQETLLRDLAHAKSDLMVTRGRFRATMDVMRRLAGWGKGKAIDATEVDLIECVRDAQALVDEMTLEFQK